MVDSEQLQLEVDRLIVDLEMLSAPMRPEIEKLIEQAVKTVRTMVPATELTETEDMRETAFLQLLQARVEELKASSTSSELWMRVSLVLATITTQK